MTDADSKPYKKDKIRLTIEGPRDTDIWGYGGISKEHTAAYGVQNPLGVEILHMDDMEVKFKLNGVNPVIANGLRRLLFSNVPTVAIETIHIWQNTGVVQDEVLAHRLGLIPFHINPDDLDMRAPSEEFSDRNAFKFEIKTGVVTAEMLDPKGRYCAIYAKDMVWVPLTQEQATKFKDKPPKVVHEDILITKLRPGQELEMEMYCEKGYGKTHSKWNPVATASYKYETQIEIDNDSMVPEEKQRLVDLCPQKVFEIEESGDVVAARKDDCTTCRLCIEGLTDKIHLYKERDNYIYHIESTGALPIRRLLKLALEALKEKAVNGMDNLRS